MNDILKMGGGEDVLPLGEINKDVALLSVEALDKHDCIIVLCVYIVYVERENLLNLNLTKVSSPSSHVHVR